MLKTPTGNNVAASANGRDEVDLMKLEISSSGVAPSICPNLELTSTGPVKLWKSSNKVAPASNIIAISGLPVTIWVEATNYSSSVRDISIKAIVNNDIKDEVKATAVWVDTMQVYTNTGNRVSTPTPSNLGVDNQGLLNFISNYGNASDNSLYGFGVYRPIPGISPPKDGFFGGRILFEFEIKPLGIKSELNTLGIKYDISRRIARNNEYLTYSSTQIKNQISAFPNQIEEGNDDSECFCPTGPSDMIDEDAIPLNDELFSYDAPSEIALGSSRAFSIRRLDFKEFVRVSFGIDISGNIQEGSKCSNDYNWNLEYGLKSSSTITPSDPYDGNSQLLEQTVGGIQVSTPRRLAGNGNGSISFSSLQSSTILTYLLEFSSTSNQWNLYGKLGSTTNLIATSNTTPSGPWTISYSSVNINISNGSITFSPGALFLFNIWNLPATLNSMTAN